MCVWVHRHTFLCACVEARDAFLSDSASYFLSHGLSLNLEFSDWLAWLASEPQISVLPALGFGVGAAVDRLCES